MNSMGCTIQTVFSGSTFSCSVTSLIRVASSGSPRGQSVHRHGSPPCICSTRNTELQGQVEYGQIQGTREALCGEGIKALLEVFCRRVASGGENSIETGMGRVC